MKSKNKFLLPKHVKPERYKITIRPDLKLFTFSGEETVYLRLEKSSKKIVFHSKDLEIQNVSIKYGGEIFKTESIKLEDDSETAVFSFSKMIPKGKAELSLNFKGKLLDDMRGFYRSRYRVKEEEHWLVTTQFESTDARRAFPCFDEPSAKAIFDVTMIVPSSHEAISNTFPSAVREHEAGYKIVQFAPTPLMSTYLLAFISGNFESIEGKNKDGVLVRVFVTPGKKKQAEFALEVAKKSLAFYSEYFGIAYPLPALDLIAIPDFAAGAMENWGAVTYRESALLVDPDHTSEEARRWTAMVIAHEIAHQWFGNLVTMEWWTDLWLNEGFASFAEYLAIDNVFPEWNVWNEFTVMEQSAALRLDSLNSTHPIEVLVGHPGEIAEIFDAVSYSKGAVVVRMLAEYLGEEKFRGGLRYYLKKYSFSNAKTIDLWLALEKFSGKPVRRIMENWTKKAGFPLISLSESGKKLKLRQTRFFLSPLSRKASKDKTYWTVPVIVKSRGKKEEKFLLEGREKNIPARWDGWLKMNFREAGFFMVDYPEKFLVSLKEAISKKQLGIADRIGIIRDVFSLAESGQTPTTLALFLAGVFKDEEEYAVWLELSHRLSHLKNLFYKELFEKDFCKFGRGIFSNKAEQLGWEKRAGENFSDSLLRDMILFQLGSYGSAETLEKAAGLFDNYARRGKSIEKDIRSAVYFLAAKSGGERRYKKIIELYKKTELPDEKNRLGKALGFFQDERLLNKTLEFSLSKNVRLQDMPSIFGAVAGNPAGTLLAWRFLKKNWKKYLNRVGGAGGHILSKVIPPLAGLREKKFAKDVQNFFRKNDVPGISRTVSQVVERIFANALWLSRDREKVRKWLVNKNHEL